MPGLEASGPAVTSQPVLSPLAFTKSRNKLRTSRSQCLQRETGEN